MWGHPLEHRKPTSGHNYKEKWLFLPHPLSTANSSSARDGVSWATPSTHIGSLNGWILWRQPWQLGRHEWVATLCPEDIMSQHSPLLLSFCPTSVTFPEPWVGLYGCSIWEWVHISPYFQHFDQLSISAIIIATCKRKLPWSMVIDTNI